MTDKCSPIKVVRHDVNSSTQTRTSSGVLKVVQLADNTSLDNKNEGLDEDFVQCSPEFLQNQPVPVDDDNYYRFSTNFVTPPLKKTSSQPHGHGAVVQVRITGHDNFLDDYITFRFPHYRTTSLLPLQWKT